MNQKKQFKLKLIKSGILAISGIYLAGCSYLYVQQDDLIFKPSKNIHSYPEDKNFNFTYENIWITVPNSDDKIV